MLKDKNIALIGAGNMAEAIIAGMLKAGVAEPRQLLVTDVMEARLKYCEKQFKVRTTQDNHEAAMWADIIILAVKPQVMDEVLVELHFAAHDNRLVISIAAGYPLSRLLTHMDLKSRVIRAMPNTPSLVLEGATALACGPTVSEEQLQLAKRIFESVGKVVVVEERLIDTVTGLSGSGPAYVYVMIEALADGGVKMGLSRQVAQLLAAQTVLGAARMVIESGEHPGTLKDRVASPGGTTIAGLHSLEQGQLRATLMDAVEASARRSQELAGRDSEKVATTRSSPSRIRRKRIPSRRRKR